MNLRDKYDSRRTFLKKMAFAGIALAGGDLFAATANGGSISGQCRSFRDYKEICKNGK